MIVLATATHFPAPRLPGTAGVRKQAGDADQDRTADPAKAASEG
jgi:hypothetical protein